ncbi:hypothetical protein TIFTF001_024531 [Ficus carica]|uniref:Uncharacterized protein n=1 Tax=Ficus carica TaxID=3494 RepID=A0AA88AGX3_FICCA|nr:hypothetical protein TIFTF001_024531 [Ficus carica]
MVVRDRAPALLNSLSYALVQPINAALITEVLKVEVLVRHWTQKDELVSSSVISEAVKKLMVSEESDEARKRAKKLGHELRKATAEGGPHVKQ